MVFDRRSREFRVRDDHRAVGEPTAPFAVDTDHEGRRMVPTGECPKALQPDVLAGRQPPRIHEANPRIGQGKTGPLLDHTHAVRVDRMHGVRRMLPHAFPQKPSGVSDQDQLPIVRAQLQWGPHVGRETCKIEDVLPVEPCLVQHRLERDHVGLVHSRGPAVSPNSR